MEEFSDVRFKQRAVI